MGEEQLAFLRVAGKYGLIFFGLLGVVFVIAVLTPKLAAFVDRQRAKHGHPPEPLPPPVDPADYQIRGIFETDRSRKLREKKENKEQDNGKK